MPRDYKRSYSRSPKRSRTRSPAEKRVNGNGSENGAATNTTVTERNGADYENGRSNGDSNRNRDNRSRSRSRSRDRRNRSSRDRGGRDRSRNRDRYSRDRSDSFERLSEEDQCRIHVADLTDAITQYDIEKNFRKFGELKEVWMAKNPPCFAFCVFKNKDDAALAVKEMDGRTIGSSRIRVTFARPRTKGRRRRWDPNMRCYQCGQRGHFSRDCDGGRGYGGGGRRRDDRRSNSRGRYNDRRRSRSRSRSYHSRSRNQ